MLGHMLSVRFVPIEHSPKVSLAAMLSLQRGIAPIPENISNYCSYSVATSSKNPTPPKTLKPSSAQPPAIIPVDLSVARKTGLNDAHVASDRVRVFSSRDHPLHRLGSLVVLGHALYPGHGRRLRAGVHGDSVHRRLWTGRLGSSKGTARAKGLGHYSRRPESVVVDSADAALCVVQSPWTLGAPRYFHAPEPVRYHSRWS